MVLSPAAGSREWEQWEGVQDRSHLQALLTRYWPPLWPSEHSSHSLSFHACAGKCSWGKECRFLHTSPSTSSLYVHCCVCFQASHPLSLSLSLSVTHTNTHTHTHTHEHVHTRAHTHTHTHTHTDDQDLPVMKPVTEKLPPHERRMASLAPQANFPHAPFLPPPHGHPHGSPHMRRHPDRYMLPVSPFMGPPGPHFMGLPPEGIH